VFKEDSDTGVRTKLLPEHVLAICPWLWAFKQTWPRGCDLKLGSLHILTLEMLKQEFEESDRNTSILFLLEDTDGGISSVHQVPCAPSVSRVSPFGETVAERIASEILITGHGVTNHLQQGTLRIPHIVVCVEVLRSLGEYFIYTAPGIGASPNTIPLILESAGDFVPRRFRNFASAGAPA